MNVVVIGGGITGQLVQFCIPEAQIFDWGKPVESRRLTREWGANYLWEPIYGLPTRYFTVVTHVDGAPATVDSVRRYKAKVGKSHEVLTPQAMEQVIHRQFPVRMTGYEFTETIPCTIQYGHRAVGIDTEMRCVHWEGGGVSKYDFLINTIPMYALLSLIQGDAPWASVRDVPAAFTHQPIYVRAMARPPDAPYDTDVLYVNYLSPDGTGPYRYCDRGDERHYEGLTNMGMIANKKIIPGKIHDLPHELMLRLGHALNSRGIYCFGRFGAWRSDELVHQTYRRIVAFKRTVNL